jgi:hypothetical protein
MACLRLVLLELLVCVHVIGAAVLFRRLWPRESPWLALFLPALTLVTLCNFIEHVLPLTELGLLLPVTTTGLLWCMLKFRDEWKELRVPSALFVLAFTYCLVVRVLHPEISFWTEALPDLARVLDFCRGDRVPPTDTWLPPFDHGGYYTFQHYGASLLIRLFQLDGGTGYNLSFVLLDAWICLAGAAVAHALTGKNWIALVGLLLVAASFSGGAVIMMLFSSYGYDPLLAYDMHHGWADQHHNPLWKLLAADPYQTRTRLFMPGQGIYLPQYHPDLGGFYLTLLTAFAVVEAGRAERTVAPWVLLIVLPAMCVITSVWFVPVVAFLAAGGALVAWLTHRRPENLRVAVIVAGAMVVLLLPSIWTLLANAAPQGVRLTTKDEHTWPWLFVEQWWPVYVPWLLLLFVWRKLDAPARWLHAAVPLLLVIFEFITIGWREPTLEKIWSAIFAVGVVCLWPLVLRQRGWPFRAVSFLLVAIIGISLVDWWRASVLYNGRMKLDTRFQGDAVLYANPQERRLMEVAARLKHATILNGEVWWGYWLSPALAEFTDNDCFIGWTYPEELAGHSKEADARAKFSGDFYLGRIQNPLPYLAANDIAAVLIWPEDQIPDNVLAQLQKELAPDYVYIDCKMDQPANAGLFLRK